MRTAINPSAVVQSKLNVRRQEQRAKKNAKKKSEHRDLTLDELLGECEGFISTFELDDETVKILKYRLAPEDLDELLYTDRLTDRLWNRGTKEELRSHNSEIVKDWILEEKKYRIIHVKNHWDLVRFEFVFCF